MIRLRDSLIKMGEELSQAAKSEAHQRENSQYYQRRLEELKVEMQELAQREEEASRRCMELVRPGLVGSGATEHLGWGGNFLLGVRNAFLMGLLRWVTKEREAEGDGLRDDTAIGCKLLRCNQSQPMTSAAGSIQTQASGLCLIQGQPSTGWPQAAGVVAQCI